MAEEDKSSLIDIPKPTTPGDIGAVGLGLAIGYFVGASAHNHGADMTPGSVAVYVSAGFLGLKNTIQALMGMRIARASAERTDVLLRAKRLDKEIEKEAKIPLPKSFSNEERLRELLVGQRRRDLLDKIEQREAGLIKDSELESFLKSAIEYWSDAITARKQAEAHWGPAGSGS